MPVGAEVVGGRCRRRSGGRSPPGRRQRAGEAVEIAGDELTGEQIAALYGQRAGLPERFEARPLSVLAEDSDQEAMFTWFTQLPAYRADFDATRA